ncbi:MAG TPA: sugar ABC transporter permease [Deinococcales bacterium]|nr:sugar ABC transporter permease [Deinococcales bacterium]
MQATAAPAFDVNRGKRARRRKDLINGYLFIAPWLIGFLAFTAGPMLFSLYASFTRYSIIEPARWVGLENFRTIFTDDQYFRISLGNTMFYALLAVPFGIFIGLTIAVLLNLEVPGQRMWRTFFFLPKVLTGVAVLLLWMWVFNPQVGPVNAFLRFVGVENPPNWFFDPIWSKPALVIMSGWGAAGGFLIYLAGLRGIPKELYEAAQIDGASAFRQFVSVTVPMMSPTILFKLITGITGALQFWEATLIINNGEPGSPSYSTLFYGLYMYNTAFKEYRMGYACALAWILLVITLIITAIQLWASKRWVHYGGGR